MPLGVEVALRGVFNRARRGLYAGKQIRSGNNISEDGKNKTRRFWRPNSQYVNLYSPALERSVRVRVTASALRTIDKYGGLDGYLLNHAEEELDSDLGARLQQEIRTALQRKRALQQQRSLLPPSAAAALASGIDAPA
ncbi:MRPL28 [Auxenochlorella protothecoides x Auxenochlorella symbiontica]